MAIGWHWLLLSTDVCPWSSTAQYFKFSRVFSEARGLVHSDCSMVCSLLQASETAAFSWYSFDSTNSSSPPSPSANYCHLQQRDWEEISFCTFSDFLLLFCCLPCCQQRKKADVKMNVVSHPAVSSSGWWSVALMPLLSEPISCQWHSLNLCFSPASETTTDGAVCWWRDVAFLHLLLLLA